MYDVFFYEAFEEEQKELKRFLPKEINAGFTGKTIQEYGKKEAQAKLISTRTQSIFPFEWADEIDAVLSRSTGYDYILEYKNKTNGNFSCGYLPLYCARAVAEHAMMLWMALLRKLPKQIEQFKIFHRDGLTGSECECKNLLVVGVGNIGYEVCKIGKGLGMYVKGVDIVKRYEDVKYVTYEKGIEDADVVVCAMNLTDENCAYFNYEKLKIAKSGLIFVNIARGEFSPMDDMNRLIDERVIGGIGLDVFQDEKNIATFLRLNKKSDEKAYSELQKLSKKSNVILTPHNAFNTKESVERKAKQSVEQVVAYLKKGLFKWSIPE